MKNKTTKQGDNFFEELEKDDLRRAEFELSNLLIELEAKKVNLRRLKAELAKLKVETAKDKAFLKMDKIRSSRVQIEFENALREAESRIAKINVLVYSLENHVIDTERTLVGSEPVLRPILENRNREIALRKLLCLIETF